MNRLCVEYAFHLQAIATSWSSHPLCAADPQARDTCPVIWISRPGVLESASHSLCGEENKGFPDRAQQLSARLGRQSTAAVVAYTVQDRCTLTHSQVNNRFQNCVHTFHSLTSPFSMLVTGSGVRKYSNFWWGRNCKLQLSECWGKILDAALCNAAER